MDGWHINGHTDGDRLRALRVEAELGVREFAELLGCHERHYSKFERGDASAQPGDVLGHKIAHRLGERLQRPVSVADFATKVPSRRTGRAA